jgi:hypothetical protein
MHIRSSFRSSVRSSLLLVLLIAIGGACVLTAITGARRTQTAMRRFVAYNHPEDLSLFFDPTPGIATRVLHLPEVARTTRLPYLMMSADPNRLGKVGVFGASDSNALNVMSRPIVLHGRLADPRRPDEAVVNDRGARQAGIRVGDRVTLYGFSPAQIAKVSQSGFLGTERPEGPRYAVRIVGVIREPDDIAVVPVAQGTTYDTLGSLYTTAAFTRSYAASVHIPFDDLPGNEIVRVQLRSGASSLASFTGDVDRIANGHAQILPGSNVQITAAAVQRGIDVEMVGLLIFAVLAAVAVVVLVGFTLSRTIRLAGDDMPQLEALGMSPRQRLGAALALPLTTVMLGCIGAVALAVAASPLTPIGIARQAEIHPGVAVNLTLLATGFVGLLVLLVPFVVVGALTAARSTTIRGARTRPRRRTTAEGTLRRMGLGAAATVGVSAAWSRSQRGALGRASVAAVALATASVVGAATFRASLDHLVASPKQQGWTFDVVVGNTNDQTDQSAQDAPKLANNRDVAAFASIAAPPETPTIDGRSIGLAGVGELQGTVEPLMLDGQFATAPDEIVLGRRSLTALHKHIGDLVTIHAGPRHITARIVGTALMLSAGSDFSSRLDEGAIIPLAGLKQLEPDAFVTVFFVRFAPGVDHAAALASIRRDFPRDMLQRIPAQDIENLARVDLLPWLVAALVAFLALVTLAHNLFTSVSRRRHTLATLKAIGLDRRQLAGSVYWQTAAITVVGIVIGVPAGVIIGRATWRYVADQIGSIQQPIAPSLAIGLCVGLAVATAALIAGGPALQAARTRAAVALRDE